MFEEVEVDSSESWNESGNESTDSGVISAFLDFEVLDRVLDLFEGESVGLVVYDFGGGFDFVFETLGPLDFEVIVHELVIGDVNWDGADFGG